MEYSRPYKCQHLNNSLVNSHLQDSDNHETTQSSTKQKAKECATPVLLFLKRGGKSLY